MQHLYSSCMAVDWAQRTHSLMMECRLGQQLTDSRLSKSSGRGSWATQNSYYCESQQRNGEAEARYTLGCSWSWLDDFSHQAHKCLQGPPTYSLSSYLLYFIIRSYLIKCTLLSCNIYFLKEITILRSLVAIYSAYPSFKTTTLDSFHNKSLIFYKSRKLDALITSTHWHSTLLN